MLEFRWVAGLTLWTVLSGPVLVEIASIGQVRRWMQPVPAIKRVETAPAPTPSPTTETVGQPPS